MNAPAVSVTRPGVGRRVRWIGTRPQLTVMAAQWMGGAGNLVFAIALARVLEPSGYAHMTAFLGAYMLLSVPGAALSAAGALDPDRLAALSRRIAAAAGIVGVVLVAASAPLAHRLGVETGVIVALGIAAPAAGLLGVQRGLAYGREDHRRIATSLVAEPAVRLAAGIVLAIAGGPTGAAMATALAGYAGVAALSGPRHRTPGGQRLESPPRRADRSSRQVVASAFPFLLIAVLQTVDLLVADRVLDREGAARFGALSTIGGAAVFATATVPLVLLPSLRTLRDDGPGHRRSPAAAATVLTATVGVAIALGGAVVAGPFIGATFGADYAGVAHLVGPYLVAMALIAVIRVRLAQLVARGRAGWATIAVATAVVAEVVVIAMVARSPGSVVATTLATTAGLAVVLELPAIAHSWPAVTAGTWLRRRHRELAAMAGLCAVATIARVSTSRGLWVDEAISVRQAELPFGQMLADMRYTDVHPPFHHAVLWVTVRLFGTSEFAVRLPSLVAGVALVPVLGWVGRVMYDRRTGWVAAAMATVAPFCVWYSQEARMYSQFMLFAAIAVGAQVQAVRRGRRRDWVLYGLATGALVWTQYFAVLPIAVQQLAFLGVVWVRRSDRVERRRLLLGWLASTLVVVVAVAPMMPLLRDQLAAYADRGAGLVPGQAGAGSSAIGGAISIYALGANLIWAMVGYHADGAMVQVAALWPLLMLVALVLLGRGRSRPSLLLLGLIVVPLGALFAIGSLKRDLFELRYFCGAVPALLLLAARFVTATARRHVAVTVTASAFVAVMAVGLVDQQLNGANPRLYDFEGAFDRINDDAGPDDIVLYEPSYLAEVVEYYAPDIESHPVGSRVPAGATVWVLSTDRIVNAEATSARLGSELADLEQDRDVVDRFTVPNVLVWELEPR